MTVTLEKIREIAIDSIATFTDVNGNIYHFSFDLCYDPEIERYFLRDVNYFKNEVDQCYWCSDRMNLSLEFGARWDYQEIEDRLKEYIYNPVRGNPQILLNLT